MTLPEHDQLFQGLSDGLLLLDPFGYIKYANPAAAGITGYAADELAGQSVDILYLDPTDSIKSEYERTQALKRKKFISEGWKKKKDGRSYWGEMTISALEDEDGAYAGFACLLRDLTEKKAEEIRLRKSEESFRLMVEGVHEYSIFMLDPTGHIMSWNEGAKRIQGYTANEIIGRHFSIFYIAEDLASGKPEMELRVARETGKYEEEGWRVKKNGSLFWANVVITALWNQQNQIIGFSKVTRDLTERKENEEDLRQSEERYRSLIEQLTDYAIFLLDEKGRIISWNEGAKRIKGYQREEIIGKYFSIFYPEEDILSGKPDMELRVARSVGKYEEEGWRLKKDGSRFWANVVITAVYNAKGNLIGFSKVTRDLTERKEAEEALRQSHDRYRRLAGELRLTNRQLTEANEELAQFTSIASHDLQEPVRTIKSFLQLIDVKLDETQNKELRTYIAKAINASNRMRELILNLLHYSQLSKNEIIEEEVKVETLFQEALQNMKLAIENSGAQISLQTEVEQVTGDRVQLVQLIQNLLSNALKFTDTDHPQIAIRCTMHKGLVRFSVSDNGIGIANADLHKVFDIFRRLHTPRDYPGTGIGLAICKKIVDRHRGRIWPESEPGKGTTFYFTLHEQELTA